MKVRYHFIEARLGEDFAKEKISEVKRLIKGSVTFTLSGITGVGGSIFLRYLALQNFAYFVYIDIYQLGEISRLNYYQVILNELGVKKNPDDEIDALNLCREQVKTLCKKEKRVVFIFNRFDQLKPIFSNQFFADLMSLKNVNLEKIVFIFTSIRPFLEIVPSDISADKVGLFSKTVYLLPYSRKDTKKLLLISAGTSVRSRTFIDKVIELSGGHFQLLQLFLKSERLDPPFIDPFIKYQLREIYNSLSYTERQTVKNIAQKKRVGETSNHLQGVGVVKLTKAGWQFFTPIFGEFLQNSLLPKFSQKEARFFRLLKQHLGQVITKEEIFCAVWKENPDEASDWGLSSLLYRLRKHPQVLSQNYVIENHKKTGYIMLRGN